MPRSPYKLIFRPYEVGKLKLRSRLICGPMFVGYANTDGTVSERMLAHYERRAQGRPAMLITEHMAVNPAGAQFSNMVVLSDQKCLPGLTQLAERIKKYGPVAVAQIYHAGRYAGPWEQYKKARRLAPSATPFPLFGDMEATPQEMTLDEIQETIQAFADAAALVKAAGFDGVELHGATGYLLSQFLSPRMNKREDDYGGSLDNRMKFPLDVFAAVRKAVGQEFIIGYQCLVKEFVPEGWDFPESGQFAQRLQKEGVDYFIPQGGTIESWNDPDVRQTLQIETYQVDMIKKFSRGIRGTPVFACGRIYDPALGETVITRGVADGIVVSRGMFADPDWILKSEEGRAADLLHCIPDCYECIQTQKTGATCAVWPYEIKKKGIWD
ncbi:MAG TPA: NADH:flavin oxidoreductase [Nitrospirales bacterium]|nr:NADH:flavin oxidoreductase [Nitrospirales bacterium]